MYSQWKALAAFLRHVRADWTVNQKSLFRPGFQATFAYRFGVWRRELPRPVAILLAPLHQIMYVFVRNFYGIELPSTARIGRYFSIGHQSGIVVHPYAEIGDHCSIRQNVTIGAKSNATYTQAPKLGDRVSVGAGAVLIGNIRIGDGATIGPNAVVMTNVPAGAVVVAQPPRIIPAPATATAAGSVIASAR